MTFDPAVLFALVIVFALAAYVTLDGFDLGVGIVFPFFPRQDQRDLLVNSIAPVWDGNETWLVLGGICLFAGFPLAYAVLMPALYFPILCMLAGLIFRGVSFEFRARSRSRRHLWDATFMGGSTVAAFFQGATLGGVLQGVEVQGRAFAGGPLDWATGFTMLTGMALVVGYALLGSTWLVMKTRGLVQRRARRLAWPLALGTLYFIAAVSLATVSLGLGYHLRWLAWPGILVTGLVPLAVAILMLALFRALRSSRQSLPFFLTLGLFGLNFVGLGISMFPFVVPARITLWQAAAPQSSLMVLLVGAAGLLPVILAYSGLGYWVFRGQVSETDGYH